MKISDRLFRIGWGLILFSFVPGLIASWISGIGFCVLAVGLSALLIELRAERKAQQAKSLSN